MTPSILEILKTSEARLGNVDSPRLSAEVIISEVLHCSRISLVLERDKSVSPTDLECIFSLVERRAKGEPLAYLLGNREFYGLDFKVDSSTLIPRPETEHIIEEVTKSFDAEASLSFADLGTGSGAIAVTLATLFEHAKGIAVDLSLDALRVAKKNALLHGVEQRIAFLLGDFMEPLFKAQSLDFIVSNPPYVPQDEYDGASFEVTKFEPLTALVSGVDGLDHIKALLPQIEMGLKQNGLAFLEIGFQQAEAVGQFLKTDVHGLCLVDVVQDLAGHDRVLKLQKK
ncbi:peptide chain release factor N(5)-glutamine methyltransferase [Pseudodesulfovibrio piezophilus]|uniref:Release factor glutamine methyltransferase n=1 Tax=Pseudodesulfovibrio piezophilus (strain DSM 21447 / JCM 15486 / C1TLV30) TaxID=1322246 RepID=M1WN90_PSEP2|nr:peptide chain release factor N(5)-glutamine methyltransferase [Pseudodesulfovibrio piezophilus]CCH47414.1 Modification methylase, HemK family [Pseudodesulfovibrio piezophilus C1TLV30]